MTNDELRQKKFSMICLGCDKNKVDSEKMTFLLQNYGLTYTNNLDEANIIIINTCAFINDAKKESIDTILETAQLKNKERGENLEKLIVCGCLAQRYYDEVKTSFDEVDAVVRLKNNEQIVNIVKTLYGKVYISSAKRFG